MLVKSELEAAKQLVHNLTFDFDSQNFLNTSLQKFFVKLQAKALGERPEEVIDTLEPRYEEMLEFTPVFQIFNNEFGLIAEKTRNDKFKEKEVAKKKDWVKKNTTYISYDFDGGEKQ